MALALASRPLGFTSRPLPSRPLTSSPSGASSHATNSSPVVTPTPATTSPPRILSRKAPTSTSSLSPAARPSLTAGRSKFHRWQEVSPASNEGPYLPFPASASPAGVAIPGSMDGRMSFRDVLLTASQAPPPGLIKDPTPPVKAVLLTAARHIHSPRRAVPDVDDGWRVEPVHGLDESSEKLCLVYPILIEATPVALGERGPGGPPSPPPPPAKGGDDPRGFSPRRLAGSGGCSGDGRSSRGSARGPVHSRLGPPVHTTCHVTPAVTSVLHVVHVPEEEQPSPGDVVHVAPGAATEAPMVVDDVPSGVPDGAAVPAGPMGDDGIEMAAVLGARSRLRDPPLSYSRRRSRVVAVATPPRAPAEQFINHITSKKKIQDRPGKPCPSPESQGCWPAC
ncbi:hypothetical protein ZEAMMB73_Zm00001d044938 [Zea mays]|uniref:Uncharacterized protein n=1 Tax=Zea mays TaxID=4577 RepID=A0A1D6NSC9_MAIZE|nr:hypothetical protein ZEAMMB73_Zm00001d044938 [Zea mays]